MDMEKAISSEIPSCRTKEKKKKKRKDTEANPKSEQEHITDVKERRNRKIKKTSDTLEESSLSLDHGADIVTKAKKERKKKVDELNAVVSERTSLEGRHKRPKNDESCVDTSLEPEADLTVEKKRKMKRRSDDIVSGKKKKTQRSDNGDDDCTKVDDKSLELETDVTLQKKKKMKKEAQRSGGDETVVVDNEIEDTSRKEIINIDPLVDDVTSGKKKKSKKKSSSLVLTEAEDIPSLENGADVALGKREMKREKRVESGIVEVNGVDRATPIVSSEPLVSQDSPPTSENTTKRKKKKRRNSESQKHHDIDQDENQNNDVPIDTEGTNSENPSLSEDLSCAEDKKRKKTKKNKIQESLEATEMDNVVVDKTESVQASEKSSVGVMEPEAEQVQEEPSLSLVNSIDLEMKNVNLDSEVSGAVSEPGLNLELGKLKTYKRKRISKDCSEVKKSSVSGAANDVDPPDLRLDIINKEGPETTLVTQTRKKLLILDVNGILVDFVGFIHNSEEYKADIEISKKHVFKRPYCDEFIQFCFKNFTVAVWSSRMKWNVELVTNFLFGDLKKELLFIWDQSHCTMTRFKTLDNFRKPLVLKELKKVWDRIEKGDYDETNTLLLDDSPYKALCNPANTAIFPKSYRYTDREDNSLGTGGALRTYLEGLLLADNVQIYVQQYPFGQQAIGESHRSWDFYKRVIDGKIGKRF